MIAELDARHARATYITASQDLADILMPAVEAYSRNDRQLYMLLEEGAGSHVILLDVEPLPEDLAETIGEIEHVQIPPGRTIAGIVGHRGRAMTADEALVSRGLFLEFMRSATRNSDRWNPTPEKRRSRKTIADLKAMPPMHWLVRGLIPMRSVGFVVAGPNIGKTAWTLGAALSVYYGRDHIGRRCAAGSVLVALGEGVSGIGRRIEAWQREHGPLPDTGNRYFEVLDRLPPLSSRDGQEALYRDLRDAERDHGHMPTLVVIDTLSSLWGGESEDSAEVAGPFMNALSSMSAALGVTFCILHHVIKGNGDTRQRADRLSMAHMRGSGSFVGAADFVLGLEPTGDDTVRLSTLKQKDAERAAPETLRLHKVVLGQNSDGDNYGGAFFVPGPTADEDKVEREKERRRTESQELEMVIKAVAELEAKARVKSKRDITKHAKINHKRGCELLDLALEQDPPLVVNLGTKASPDYRVPTRSEAFSERGERTTDTAFRSSLPPLGGGTSGTTGRSAGGNEAVRSGRSSAGGRASA